MSRDEGGVRREEGGAMRQEVRRSRSRRNLSLDVRPAAAPRPHTPLTPLPTH